MQKSGKSLEQVVGHLESVLSGSKNATIEIRKRLKDKVTGRLREHDVVITLREAHHILIIALECRDRSRPIGVDQVEAFSKKCEQTGINQGIIVSAHGFCNTALVKAAALSIQCLTMAEALSFSWLNANTLRKEQINITHTHANFVLQSKQVSQSLQNYTLVDSRGIEVLREMLTINAIQQLQLLREQPGHVDTGSASFIFDGQGYGIKDNLTTTVYPLEQIVLEVKYEVIVGFTPFKLYQYSDTSDGNVIGDAAVANIDFGDFSGDLAFVHDPQRGIKLAFFPPMGYKATLKQLDKDNGD
jgi:hypothetical protein